MDDKLIKDSLRLMLNMRQQNRLEERASSDRVRTGRITHSWAGNCGRRIAYDVRFRDADIAAGNDPEKKAEAQALYGPDPDAYDESSLWTFMLGDMIHETAQLAVTSKMAELGGTVEHEIDCSIQTGMLHTSGRLDTLVNDCAGDGGLLVVEFKSINGYGFKAMTTGARSGDKPEGPKLPNLLQLGLNMVGAADQCGVPVDQVRGALVYISKEANNFVRSSDPLDRMIAEFHYTWAEIADLVNVEMARLTNIVGQVDAGETTQVVRSIPSYGPGQIVSIGDKGGSYQSVDGRVMSAWECRYCPFASRCKVDG